MQTTLDASSAPPLAFRIVRRATIEGGAARTLDHRPH
jgi:hypothetical protein